MHIVIVWAWGSWISNLAHIIWDLWYKNLIAIDSQESQITTALKEKWIPVKIGHWKYDIKDDDIVIYSEATKDSPEVQSAFNLKKEHHLPLKIWNYFEFLWELSKYFRTVWIAWTNGKSSSTSLAIVAWKTCIPELWLWIVWALVPDLWNKSYYLKNEAKDEFHLLFDYIFTGKRLPYELVKKYYFFLEACEYKRHFLHLDLEYLLITNLELDHTDYYKDWEDYRSAFLQINQNTKKLTFVLENKGNTVETDYSWFKDIKTLPIRHFELEHVRWKHTDCNASLIAWLLQELNPSLSIESIEEIFKPFRWVWRRLEYLSTLENWAKVFSDYGHIASSLEIWYKTLKEHFPDKKIFCVFQPHQMRRVLAWWDEFQKVIPEFDKAIIYSIYAAREPLELFKEEPLFLEHKFNSVREVWEFFAQGVWAEYYEDFNELSKRILELTDKDSIIAVFTAWDLDYQIRKLLKLC